MSNKNKKKQRESAEYQMARRERAKQLDAAYDRLGLNPAPPEAPSPDNRQALVISRAPCGWLATYPKNSKMMQLLGTCTIVLSYGQKVSAEVVKKWLGQSNPEYKIVIDDGSMEVEG